MATKRTLSFNIQVYDSLEELSENDKFLLKRAKEARDNAYAPYSGFQVGAALRLDNEEIVVGSNQENASYPSGLCAERVAIFHAGATYPNMIIKTLAVTVSSKDYEVSEPAAPCGNCRQAIFEYEFKQKTPIRILMMGSSGKVLECNSIADLLPLGFNNSYLK